MLDLVNLFVYQKTMCYMIEETDFIIYIHGVEEAFYSDFMCCRIYFIKRYVLRFSEHHS